MSAACHARIAWPLAWCCPPSEKQQAGPAAAAQRLVHGMPAVNNILKEIDSDLIEPQRLAGAVVDQVVIRRRKRDYNGRALTAREALQAMVFEVMLVAVAAQNLAQGKTLEDVDLARLMVAWARIETLSTEAGV